MGFSRQEHWSGVPLKMRVIHLTYQRPKLTLFTLNMLRTLTLACSWQNRVVEVYFIIIDYVQ